VKTKLTTVILLFNLNFLFASNELLVNLTKIDITCFGSKDGVIEAQISGGKMPYQIKWSNGQSGNKIENLQSGWYKVEVKDKKGEIIYDSIRLESPKPISVSFNFPTVSFVDNLNAEMNIKIEGGNPWSGIEKDIYFIKIDGKSYYKNPELISNGRHVFTIEDGAGCKLEFPANMSFSLVNDVVENDNALIKVKVITRHIVMNNSQDSNYQITFK